MEKKILTEFVKRYNLGGKVNSVHWQVKDDIIRVTGVDENKEIVCQVVSKGIEGIDSGEYGIFDTKLVKSLLAVLDDNITAKVQTINLGDEDGPMPIKISLKDNKTQVDISLANPKVIPSAPELNENSLPEWNAELKLSKTLVQKFKAASSAMTANTTFTVLAIGDNVELVIGHGTTNADKFSIGVDTVSCNNLEPVRFSSDALIQVLDVIPDLDTAVMKISSAGLGYVVTQNENFAGRYFLLAKEESSND